MNSKLVLAVVVILLLLYAIFKALTTSYATLGAMQKSITETVLSGDNLPRTIKTNSAISVWFYIKEWVNEAQIVRFKDASTPIMAIRMASNRNNIIITPRSDSSSSTCDIADFPLQKWVNLIVSFNGSAMTAYWKSKDFIGSDPFSEKDYLNYKINYKSIIKIWQKHTNLIKFIPIFSFLSIFLQFFLNL